MDVHLIDGTYELFRHFYGRGRSSTAAPGSRSAAAGVAATLCSMLEDGCTHLAVATDQVVESFRNELWPGYKSSEGIDPVLLAQFAPLEEAIAALGIRLLAMVELEADDGLASAAALAAEDDRVSTVRIWSPDKDLAQCVRGTRVVQVDRRSGAVRDEAGVIERFGVEPFSIPDLLALVGDSADGFPGLKGFGEKSASVLLGRYRHLEQIPLDHTAWDPEVLARLRGAERLAARLREEFELALTFRDLATLRVDRSLVGSVDELAWPGPRDDLPAVARSLGTPGLADRVMRARSAPRPPSP